MISKKSKKESSKPEKNQKTENFEEEIIEKGLEKRSKSQSENKPKIIKKKKVEVIEEHISENEISDKNCFTNNEHDLNESVDNKKGNQKKINSLKKIKANQQKINEPTKVKKSKKEKIIEIENNQTSEKSDELKEEKTISERKSSLESQENPIKNPLLSTNKIPKNQPAIIQASTRMGNSNSSNFGIQYEVFVGGFPFPATEDDIRAHFGSCGPITDVRILKNEQGLSRGRCVLQFQHEESIEPAVSLNESILNGRIIFVELTKKTASITGKPIKYDGKKKEEPINGIAEESSSVLARNLPYCVDNEMLKQMFEDCGLIKGCRIVRNEKGESKGFGFIDFYTIQNAKKALKKTGEKVEGRNMSVIFSFPNKKKTEI